MLSFIRDDLAAVDEQIASTSSLLTAPYPASADVYEIESAVLHLIPLTEKARVKGWIDQETDFLKITVHFIAGWKWLRRLLLSTPQVFNGSNQMVDCNSRTAAVVAGFANTADLFVSLWSSSLPFLLRFTSSRVIRCGLAMLQCAFSAAHTISGVLENNNNNNSRLGTSSDTGEESFNLNLAIDIVVTVSKELLVVAKCYTDQNLATTTPTAHVEQSTAIPFDVLCVLHSVQSLLSECVVDWQWNARCRETVKLVLGLISHIEHVQNAIREQKVHRLMQSVIFPALWGEKWTSVAKYFGGRCPSHSVTFFFGQLLLTAKSQATAVFSSQSKLQTKQVALLATTPQNPMMTSNFPLLPSYDQNMTEWLHVCSTLFTTQIVAFLREYCTLLSETRTSDCRWLQMVLDALVVLRMVRLVRNFVSQAASGRVMELLMRVIAIISIRSTKSGDLPFVQQMFSLPPQTSQSSLGGEDLTAASWCLSNSGQDNSVNRRDSMMDAATAQGHLVPDTFLATVWNVTPLKNWGELISIPNSRLGLIHTSLFISYVPQEQFQRVTLPSPLVPLVQFWMDSDSNDVKLLSSPKRLLGDVISPENWKILLKHLPQ